MAHLRCEFFSETLEISTSMSVILPQTTEGQIGMANKANDGDHPVLYLLHGLSDDDTIWTRRTSIERYVAELGLAVVMPSAGRSFYANEAHGSRYWDFVSEELPAVVAQLFHVSTRREDTFVAGLSMGGYGAFKLALLRPERFAAAASLSGVLDLGERGYLGDPGSDLHRTVFGDRNIAGSDDDLLAVLRRADPSALPDLYLTCGNQDELVAGNRAFEAVAAEVGARLVADYRPGVHDWAYWDATIQDVLAWLPRAAHPGAGAGIDGCAYDRGSTDRRVPTDHHGDPGPRRGTQGAAAMPAPQSIPAGAPIWNDIAAADVPSAVAFYTRLFGWEYENFGEEFGGYGQFTLHGARVAGIGPSTAPGQGVTWTVYLHTPDVRKAVERATRAGARVLAEPMEVTGKGAMAVVVDPAGAVIGFWQPGTHLGFDVVAEANAPAWHELLTKGYADAVDFYREALGWEVVVQGDSDDFRYCVYQSDGLDPYAGIMDASAFLPESVPSHWSVYFAADDADALVARATELGATVEQEPEDTPYGRLATLVDPQGGRFKVIGVVAAP